MKDQLICPPQDHSYPPGEWSFRPRSLPALAPPPKTHPLASLPLTQTSGGRHPHPPPKLAPHLQAPGSGRPFLFSSPSQHSSPIPNRTPPQSQHSSLFPSGTRLPFSPNSPQSPFRTLLLTLEPWRPRPPSQPGASFRAPSHRHSLAGPGPPHNETDSPKARRGLPLQPPPPPRLEIRPPAAPPRPEMAPAALAPFPRPGVRGPAAGGARPNLVPGTAAPQGPTAPARSLLPGLAWHPGPFEEVKPGGPRPPSIFSLPLKKRKTQLTGHCWSLGALERVSLQSAVQTDP